MTFSCHTRLSTAAKMAMTAMTLTPYPVVNCVNKCPTSKFWWGETFQAGVRGRGQLPLARHGQNAESGGQWQNSVELEMVSARTSTPKFWSSGSPGPRTAITISERLASPGPNCSHNASQVTVSRLSQSDGVNRPVNSHFPASNTPIDIDHEASISEIIRDLSVQHILLRSPPSAG